MVVWPFSDDGDDDDDCPGPSNNNVLSNAAAVGVTNSPVLVWLLPVGPTSVVGMSLRSHSVAGAGTGSIP